MKSGPLVLFAGSLTRYSVSIDGMTSNAEIMRRERWDVITIRIPIHWSVHTYVITQCHPCMYLTYQSDIESAMSSASTVLRC